MIFGDFNIIVGDCRESMAALPERHFHTCVTSPPYFGLRDYGVDGQIGLEPTPDDFVAAMRAVFGGRENPVGLWRVLRDDGVCWVNLGDSYAGNVRGKIGDRSTLEGSPHNQEETRRVLRPTRRRDRALAPRSDRAQPGFKGKDLMGIPWRVAFALQSNGWYLRDAIIWHKPAPMPGSQRDRCTSAYEFIFQLAKRPRYYFDLEAIKENVGVPTARRDGFRGNDVYTGNRSFDNDAERGEVGKTGEPSLNGSAPRNVWRPQWVRADVEALLEYMNAVPTTPNVWRIASEGFAEAHFATYPREIPLRCIKASTSEKGCCAACGAPWVRVTERDRKPTRPGTGSKVNRASDDEGSPYNGHSGMIVGNRDPRRHTTEFRTVGWKPGCACNADVARCRVLDPFSGAGTTGVAACLLGRDYIGLELNPEYAAMSERRIRRELRPGTFADDREAPAPLFVAAAEKGGGQP